MGVCFDGVLSNTVEKSLSALIHSEGRLSQDLGQRKITKCSIMATGQKYKILLDENEGTLYTTSTTDGSSSSFLTNKTLLFLLFFSSLGHLVWPVIWTLHLQHEPCGPERSPYAGLTYDIPVPFRDVSTFVHHNSVVADATWDNWVVEPGIVALSHSYVNGKMLPQTQDSPLDNKKGVYVLSSYHSLHCLVCKIDSN